MLGVPSAAHATFANGFSIHVKCVEDLSLDDAGGAGTWRARFVATNTTATDRTVTGTDNAWTSSSDPGDPPTVFPAGTEVEWVTDAMAKTTPGESETYVQWNLLTSSGARADFRSSPRCYAAPQFLTSPRIVGVRAPGNELAVVDDQVTLPQGNYGEQVVWTDCDDSSQVGTGRTYIVAAADVDHTLQATVRYGDPVTQVQAQTPCDNSGLIRMAPSLISAPAISGAPIVGQELSIVGGSWAGTAPLVLGVKWESCDTTTCTVAGGTETYTPVPADLGRTIRAEVTQFNLLGSASVTTAPTNVVRAGSGPVLSLDAAGLAFGSLPVGAYSAARPVRLTNDGDADLTVNAPASVSEFPITTTCSPSTPLQPGDSCQVSVKFHPRYAGARSYRLALRSNDPSGPRYVDVSGVGT